MNDLGNTASVWKLDSSSIRTPRSCPVSKPSRFWTTFKIWVSKLWTSLDHSYKKYYYIFIKWSSVWFLNMYNCLNSECPVFGQNQILSIEILDTHCTEMFWTGFNRFRPQKWIWTSNMNLNLKNYFEYQIWIWTNPKSKQLLRFARIGGWIRETNIFY